MGKNAIYYRIQARLIALADEYRKHLRQAPPGSTELSLAIGAYGALMRALTVTHEVGWQPPTMESPDA